MSALKGILIFASGAAIGSGVTYIIVKKNLEDKFNAEIDEIREHYNKKKEIQKAENIIRTEGYITAEEVENRVKTVSEKAIRNDKPPEDYPDEPFEITEEEFSEGELTFEKIEADYYMGDGAFVDETDELINIEDSVGYENIERFMTSNKDIMYIRNPNLATDYLVTKLSGNYSEIIGVGGDSEDD